MQFNPVQQIDIDAIERLVDLGLVIRKQYGDKTLYKYHNKVFYKNLWHTDPILRECRGLVVQNGRVIQRPFHKMFNLNENRQGYPDSPFAVVEKVNGFMGAVSSHEGDMLYSTTGTLDSDFVQLIENHVYDKLIRKIMKYPDYTFLFEVVDESDPHIVEEDIGLHLIGIRNKHTGIYVSLSGLQVFATDATRLSSGDLIRMPKIRHMQTVGTVSALLTHCRGEGFAVWDYVMGCPVMKIKSPHYLSKKAMMRLGRNQINVMFDDPEEFRQRLDEEFYGIHNMLIREYTRDEYRELTEQQRRQLIEDYFYGK